MDLLNTIGLSVIAFIFVLGVMIFIHELGHYLVAKYLGIRVETFSLGFGPRLLGFRWGDTDYRISLLPLGGYVKMSGENYDENLTGSPDEFLSRPKLHRFAVAVAGPLMNIGLALFLLTGQYMVGIEVPAFKDDPATVEQIHEASPAAEAGLQIGDTIVAIQGDSTPTWEDVELEIATSPNQTLTLTIERNGELLKKQVTTAVNESLHLGTIGIAPDIPLAVVEVQKDSPADQAGLQGGDELISIQEQDVPENAWTAERHGMETMTEFIATHEGQPLLFKVRRDDQILETMVVPVDMDGQARAGFIVGYDVTKLPMRTEQYGLFAAAQRSVERTYRITTLTFEILGKLITGNASLKTMSGPIEIARFSGVAASAGLVSLIGFMALVSLQLGIFNLLPIPILDGGLIALLAIEGIMGRELSLRVKERIFQIGFIFLILLMGVVIFNDLAKNLAP
ncbi:MAG: RIP metalloprotease RseP [Acidobacteriota bacterium]